MIYIYDVEEFRVNLQNYGLQSAMRRPEAGGKRHGQKGTRTSKPQLVQIEQQGPWHGVVEGVVDALHPCPLKGQQGFRKHKKLGPIAKT